MTKEKFDEMCRYAVEMAGDDFDRAIGGMMARFAISRARFIDTHMPNVEEIPDGLAEAYIALKMVQIKYDIPQEKIDEAIERSLTIR